MSSTGIEWTDRTWNPVRGCSRVSEGCRNCYAEREAARFAAAGRPFHGFVQTTALPLGWTGKVALIEDKLDEPLRWRKPSRVFVNSMSDLFHEDLPDEAIDRVFAVMGAARRHTFQVLTKRPQRMLEYLLHERRDERIWDAMPGVDPWERRERQDKLRRVPIPNVWLGVSVENQSTADRRIPLLLQTPAAVRFISAEPLLGPMHLYPWLGDCDCMVEAEEGLGSHSEHCRSTFPALGWVIVGGESGPNARECDVGWIRAIVTECERSSTPVFVKQLGSRVICDDSDAAAFLRRGIRHRKGGDPAEWPEDLRIREFPR